MQSDRRPAVVVPAVPNAQGEPNEQEKAADLQRLSGAGATGLEPATSGVTGRRSNQLSYAPVRPHSMAADSRSRSGTHL